MSADDHIDHSDAIFELIRRNCEGHTFLLNSDVLDSWDFYVLLLQSVAPTPSKIKIFDYNAQEKIEVNIVDLAELYKTLAGDLFGQILSMKFVGVPLQIYHDPRCSLSLVITNPELALNFIEKWDRNFCNHLKRKRVGMGTPGVEYSRSVLSSLKVFFPNDLDRITRFAGCTLEI